MTDLDEPVTVRYEGDVVLEQAFQRRLGRIEAGGNLSIRCAAINGTLLAQGSLELQGTNIDAQRLRGRVVRLAGRRVKAELVYATERIEIGPCELDIRFVIAPEVRIHPETIGTIGVLECQRGTKPPGVGGAVALADYPSTPPDVLRFLREQAGAAPALTTPTTPAPAVAFDRSAWGGGGDSWLGGGESSGGGGWGFGAEPSKAAPAARAGWDPGAVADAWGVGGGSAPAEDPWGVGPTEAAPEPEPVAPAARPAPPEPAKKSGRSRPRPTPADNREQPRRRRRKRTRPLPSGPPVVDVPAEIVAILGDESQGRHERRDAAVRIIEHCYGKDVPLELSSLGAWVSERRDAELKRGIGQVWMSVVRHHLSTGRAPHPHVAHAFRVLKTLT